MSKNKSSIGVIGLGKFGMYLVEELAKNGKSIICVDKDENKVKKVASLTDSSYVSEDLSIQTLEEMGFKECDMIVICISEHLDSAIFATLNCINLGVNRVLTISNSDEQGVVLEKLGAEVIYPYKDSADRLTKKILNNNFLDFITLSDDVEIVEVIVPKSLYNVSVIDSHIRERYGINIIAIETDNKIVTRVDPNYKFKKDDALVVIGEINQLRKFESLK